MANPLLALVEKHAGPDFVPRLRQSLTGLVEDFWKDAPCQYPVFEFKLLGRSLKIPNLLKPMSLQSQGFAQTASASSPKTAVMHKAAAAPKPDNRPRWHAMPGEVAEKMWGEGQVLPAGDAVMEMLVKPLGLRKDMSLLDLSAGLGGSLRKISAQAGQSKGLEMDEALAMRGMELTAMASKNRQVPVSSYDPADFSMPAAYDCVLARELFYRVADKPKLLAAIAAGLKPQGQLVFADYIVDPENKAKPAILSWQKQEKGAAPLGLIEMAEALAKSGFAMRVNEDQTPFYKRETVQGLNRLVGFLANSARPDAETKKAILREVEIWIHRMGAFEQGMKFTRFHAVKSQ